MKTKGIVLSFLISCSVLAEIPCAIGLTVAPSSPTSPGTTETLKLKPAGVDASGAKLSEAIIADLNVRISVKILKNNNDVVISSQEVGSSISATSTGNLTDGLSQAVINSDVSGLAVVHCKL